jgi:hypothetical protein
MLTTILIWGYILILTSVSGHFVISIAAKARGNKFPEDITIPELSITGIAATGSFLAILSLFSGIGLLANILLFSFCVVWIFLKREEISGLFVSGIMRLKKIHFPVLLAGVVTFVLILVYTQFYPSVFDTGLYHAQNIKWISSFRVVPGLGNLHGRFAFNNQSFLLEALFSFSFLAKGPFHVLNGYLLLILSITLIRLIHKYIRTSQLKALLYTGLLILLMVFYLKLASSPTPDVFSLAGIWFIFIMYFERISSENRTLFWMPLLFISFFIVTVKLSALALVLMIFMYLQSKEEGLKKKIITVALTGLIVFIPYVIRNYILSGYLIYPSTSLGFLSPDWKIPEGLVRSMKEIISAHARTRTWINIPFSEWFPLWYSRLSAGFRMISWFVLLSPFATLGFILYAGRELRKFRNELKIIAVCYTAIVFWFVSAPNYRFIYSFLFVYILLSCIFYGLVIRDKIINAVPLLEKALLNLKKIAPPLLLFSFLIVAFCFMGKAGLRGIYSNPILPAAYKTVLVESRQINNFQLFVPRDSSSCWNSPLPCSIFQKDIGVTSVEMRGPELKDGFRHSEK